MARLDSNNSNQARRSHKVLLGFNAVLAQRRIKPTRTAGEMAGLTGTMQLLA